MSQKQNLRAPNLARFILVRAEPETLTVREVHNILKFVIPVLHRLHKTFAAIAEDNTFVGNGLPKRHEWSYDRLDGLGSIDGVMIRDSIDRVLKVLKMKYDDETEHRRRPGHVSTVAPAFLLPDKLIVVIGSLPFLMRHVELYLERRGRLGDKTFGCMVALAETKPWPGGVEGHKNTFIDVDVTEQEFYPGNLNALAAAAGLSVTKVGMDSLLELIDSKE